MPLPEDVSRVTAAFLGAIDAAVPGLVRGLYLRGSLGFGEYFRGSSDVDFVAVLAARPGRAELAALAAAHAQVQADCPARPVFDGIHLTGDDLRRPPAECPDLPHTQEWKFSRAGRFEVNPVTWHELARHGITVRGPALTEAGVWTDDRALWDFSRANLSSYWVKIAQGLAAMPAGATTPYLAAWCVLGVSRLHHLLATGSMTSKSGAGRRALEAFGSRWHPIIQEALRARERPDAPSAYDGDDTRRGRDTTAFTEMAIEASLALPPLSVPD